MFLENKTPVVTHRKHRLTEKEKPLVYRLRTLNGKHIWDLNQALECVNLTHNQLGSHRNDQVQERC